MTAVIQNLLKKRETWIICDRDDSACDNGEALFKYLAKDEKDAKLYFAIGLNCSDHQRMKRYVYTGELYILPAVTVQAKDFQGNDIIKVSKTIANYNKVLAEGTLMVTDYSRAVFDFAYLKKPVVYTQFDAESFYTEYH